MKTSFYNALFVAVIALMSTVACSKGGGSGSPAALPPPIVGPYYGNPTCATCNGMGQGFLASALARDTMYGSGSEMGLSFFGDPQVLMQTQGYPGANYQSGYFSVLPTGAYMGPFAASGYLYLPMGLPACGIPGGRYQLQTQSPGIWGNDGAGRSGENLTMMLVGAPVQVMVFLSGFTMPAAPAARGQDGNTYPYSFQTTTMVMKRADTLYTCQLAMQ